MTPETVRHAHLLPFRHSGYTESRLDDILAYAISPSDLEVARALMETKWWDYRFVHPGVCFFLFSHHYAERLSAWRSRFGVNPYGRVRGTEHPIYRSERAPGARSHKDVELIPTSPQFRTGLWRSMCFADAHGVPYDRWMTHAFAFAFDAKYQRMPMPAMLSSNDVAIAVLARWEEEKRDLLFTVKDPLYRVENYAGNRWQDDHETWLLELIAARPNPAYALSNYLGDNQLVHIARAEGRLGSEVVERALTLIERRSAP